MAERVACAVVAAGDAEAEAGADADADAVHLVVARTVRLLVGLMVAARGVQAKRVRGPLLLVGSAAARRARRRRETSARAPEATDKRHQWLGPYGAARANARGLIHHHGGRR